MQRFTSAGLLGVLGMLALSTPAHADMPGAHVGYGIGAGFVNGSALRNTLDVGIDYLHGPCSRDSTFGLFQCKGLMVSGSVVTGFRASPTYATLDGGYGLWLTFIGGSLLGGPAVRFDENTVAPGFDVRLSASLLFLQGGPRVIVVPTGRQEVQATFVIGLGIN